MSSQDSVNGEIREQLKKLKDMSFKQKAGYLFHYYKYHALITIIIICVAVSVIHSIATHRDYAFYAVLLNAETPYIDYSAYGDAFSQYAGIDMNKYQTFIDTTSKISNNYYTQDSAANTDKMSALIYTGTIDVIVADTYAFEYYAQSDSFVNLETVLPKEILEKYKDNFYYTDSDTYVTFEDTYNPDALTKRDDYVIDHHSADGMKKPVPVGIFIPKDSNLMETGCYDFLEKNNVTYQGYQSEVILGIPATAQHLDMILKFLEFLEQ